MYPAFQIRSAEDLVKGFALAIRNGRLTFEEVKNYILECTENDNRLAQVVLEKVETQLALLPFSEQNLFGKTEQTNKFLQ